MGDTSIEWTDRVWNCVRGCSRVSPGCVNCYAERQAARFANPDGPFHQFVTKVNGHAAWTGKVELVESKLTDPLTWRKPARIFVNSMSDLFHEALPDESIDLVFAVMALAPQHTFQVLTKRAEHLLEYLSDPGVEHRIAELVMLYRYTRDFNSNYEFDAREASLPEWPLPNVWIGVSVEDQPRKDRIDLLRQTPAAVRFISFEPLLEDLGELDLTDIHWAIWGGESGPGARPLNIEWIRSGMRQAARFGTKNFVKQLGAKPEMMQGCGDCDPCLYGQPCMLAYRVGLELQDRKGGDMDEWPADLRVREYPEVVR